MMNCPKLCHDSYLNTYTDNAKNHFSLVVTDYALLMRKLLLTAISTLLTIAAIGTALPAMAEAPRLKHTALPQAPLAAETLPGVKPAKPLVTPPEAEPDETNIRTNPDGSIMVGKTRVKISGSVTVDVGKGPLGNK